MKNGSTTVLSVETFQAYEQHTGNHGNLKRVCFVFHASNKAVDSLVILLQKKTPVRARMRRRICWVLTIDLLLIQVADSHRSMPDSWLGKGKLKNEPQPKI
jgi:hypothetical protein